jgi:hypothetical protein
MKDSLRKPKPTLESLLADRQVVTGRMVIDGLKARAKRQEEFARAVEFEARNKKNLG